ncbi:MAG: hypothetical protein EZS28_011560 [Streblomastix strix]|uniref:Uncharacterized protein n=1 Tax=Streblomastix strix TaxID=222440 RepID=A0A5J4WED4_9EUKA|nr:MAG: hypothetical protein EZS28_011560 [Streblomastix strix]
MTGNIANIRQSNKINSTRLLERKRSRNDKLCQKNQSYLLRATSFRANLQEDARQAAFICSNDTTAVYDIGKLKAKEYARERIKQVFYLVKRLQLQIAAIHIPGKLNSTTDSLSRLCRSADFTLKDGIIQMICKAWNCMPQIDIFAVQYKKLTNNFVTVDLNDLGTQFHNAFNYNWSKCRTIYPSTNTSIIQSITKTEIRQSTSNNNCTDLAGTIVVHQTKEFIDQVPFPWQIRQDSGDGTENERQGSKISTRQSGRLPSGPVADVDRDLLMRCMKIRGFSEKGVNLLFNGQRFNIVNRDFYPRALLQDWLDIERITIDEIMKKDADIIFTEVIAFHTRQNNSVASANSHKACLTTMLSLIYKENLATSTNLKTNQQSVSECNNTTQKILKHLEYPNTIQPLERIKTKQILKQQRLAGQDNLLIDVNMLLQTK